MECPRGYMYNSHLALRPLRIPLLTVTVACLVLLDTICGPLLPMITGVLLLIGLLLYTYWNPPWAEVPYSIDEQGGEGGSTVVPGVFPVAPVCCEHFHSYPILVTEAVFPTYVTMNSLPPPFGPHAIYNFPEPLDREW